MVAAFLTIFRLCLLFWKPSGFQMTEVDTIYVRTGSDVTLTCPNDKVIVWLYFDSKNALAECKNGKNRINPNLDVSDRLNVTPDCQLQIQNFTTDDITTYLCTALNGNKAKINIKFRTIIIDDTDKFGVFHGIEGKYLTLQCTVIGYSSEDTLYWATYNELLTSNNTSSLSYKFLAHRSYNMKEFICMANNSKDTRSLIARVQLNLLLKPKVSITVSIDSSDMRKENNVTIRQGQHIELRCREKFNVSGDVEIFSWLFDGHNLNNYSTRVVLNEIKRERSGEYICMGKNKAGVDSDTVNIIVTYSPIIRTEDITFNEINRPRTLKCNVSGEPNTYNVTWRHNTYNKQLVRTFNKSSNAVLILPEGETNDLVFEDSGFYICNVTNGIPDESRNLWQSGEIKVVVEGKPVLAKPQKSIFFGHFNETSSMSLFVLSSSNVTQVEWKNENGNSPGHYHDCSLTVNKTLFYGKSLDVPGYRCIYQIRNTREEDFQNYTVELVNKNGRTTFDISLVSSRKPEIPRNVQVIALQVKIIVKWRIGKSGGFLQVFFIEYRKIFELEWNVVPANNKTSSVIGGLQMDTVYFVRVFSRTIVGESNRSDEVIVKTGNHHFVIHTYSWEIGVFTGAAVVVFLFCVYGMKALVKRLCLNIEPNSNNRSRSIETTIVTHGAQYDEIDSMYYHHSNVNELTLNNRPLEILPSSNNGGSIGSISTSNDDTGDYYQETVLCDTDINISEAHNVSAGSSSDDSYLVPCRKYINLEIGVGDENSEPIREQENHADSSSESNSESSETVMKSDHYYETVTTTNIEDHLYENSIETN